MKYKGKAPLNHRMRYFIWNINRRCREWRKKGSKPDHMLVTDIDCDFLEELWERQNGCDVYQPTKKLILPDYPKSGGTQHWGSDSARNASLDRINSEIGYLKSNVQFVTKVNNGAKMQIEQRKSSRPLAHKMMLEYHQND